MRRLALAVLPLVAGSLLAGSVSAPALAAPAAKKPATVSFALNGTLTGASATTLTLDVRGGKGGKAVRGTTVTVTVPATARIRLNDKAATLAALPTGARVQVSGVQSGDTRTAARVNAEAKTKAPEPETED